MLRTIYFGTLLLLAGMDLAHAEPICDLWYKADSGQLRDGATVSIRGRIVGSWAPDSDGNYSYEIEDTCSDAAFVTSERPINCRGQVTITGKFNQLAFWGMMGTVAIWVTQASCE